MGFKYNSVVRFNANTDVGLDRVSLGSIVQVLDSGTEKLFLYKDNSGVTDTTTIATAISGSNLVEEVDTEALATELANYHPLTSVDSTPINGSGNLVTSNGVYDAIAASSTVGDVKAWVKFIGSNGAISSSAGVSSVTDGGIGIYTVNLSTALPTHYAALISVPGHATTNQAYYVGAEAVSTTAIYVRTKSGVSTYSYVDCPEVYVAAIA